MSINGINCKLILEKTPRIIYFSKNILETSKGGMGVVEGKVLFSVCFFVLLFFACQGFYNGINRIFGIND